MKSLSSNSSGHPVIPMENRGANPLSGTNTISTPTNFTLTNILIFSLVIAAFLLGMMTSKVFYLEKMLDTNPTSLQGNPTQANAAPAPTENLNPKKVSIDDDPILGDKNAKVTIIEFSDYECPFCKRFYDDTLTQLKKEYIDTGKVKLVYRDLPLSFHDPMATLEGIAANCAREQGDDSTYFNYHDEIFNRTTSGGNGLTKEDLYTIASDLGLDSSSFSSCVDSKKYKDEVAKDLADAEKVGASGTPTFFIGKSTDNGVIEGNPVVGAQPFNTLKTIIDKELSQ